MAGRPLVGVLVLHWKRPDDTTRCIESVRRCSYTPLKILVVDNDSSDGSGKSIAGENPDIQFLHLPANFGFAGGNNAGLRQFVDLEVDYVLLLNDDVVIAPDSIDRLVAMAESDPQIAAVGGKVYWMHDPERLWSAGPKFPPGESPLDQGQYDQSREATYLVGCCMLVRRQVIEQVGLLDEDFFLLCEEYDWCLRMRAAGHRIVYAPEAKAWHRGSPSFGGEESASYRYYATRNWLLMLQKRGYLSRHPRRMLIIAQEWYRQSRIVLRGGGPFTLRRLRAVVQGVWDFLRGHVGEGPDWLSEKTE